MRQTVTDRGIIFLCMHELLTKSEVTPLELIPMKNFIHTKPSTLTDAGNDLRNRIMRAHKFYLTLDKSKVMDLVKKPNGYLPGIDSFLQNFIKWYNADEKNRSSLLVGLCHGYCSKMNGQANPVFQASTFVCFTHTQTHPYFITDQSFELLFRFSCNKHKEFRDDLGQLAWSFYPAGSEGGCQKKISSFYHF